MRAYAYIYECFRADARTRVHATIDALSSLRNFEYTDEGFVKGNFREVLDNKIEHSSIINDLEERISWYEVS